MAASKVQFKTIDDYINSFPEEMRSKLQTLRQAIKEEAPEAQESIRYQMPTFSLNGSYLIYFGAWKKHISLYPFSVAMAETIKEASTYNTSGKGTIQFPLAQPLPLPLVRKIVRFRIKENLE